MIGHSMRCPTLRTARGPRAGFTLVELLTVVVIIGVLVSLVTAAAIRARLSIRNRAVLVEIDQLVKALEAYRTEIGELPPDFTNQTSVLAHLRKRFPDYPVSDWATFKSHVQTGSGVNVDELTPAGALVFWLAGIPDAPGNPRPRGFSADVRQPFRAGEPRTKRFYDFEETRLRKVGTTWVYVPSALNSVASTPPYVYFRSGWNTGYDAATQYYDGSSLSAGYAVPYRNGDDTQWREARGFQILTAGFDDIYGAGSTSPRRCSQSGQGCTEADYDNHTSFSQGTIQDEIE